jgi:hypothetical protein
MKIVVRILYLVEILELCKRKQPSERDVETPSNANARAVWSAQGQVPVIGGT